MEISQVPEVPGFAVGRLLGRGGSATVWLARENRTGRDFAVKCFHSGQGGPGGGEPLSEDAVRREIRILSVLDHPHLVKAREAVRLPAVPDGGTALVMDYAPGGSLAALVASRGRLGVGETVTVLTPIAQALGYLHSKGFTHSDVSPGNVLFTAQGKPLLSDVGIARMLGDPGCAAEPGTPGFVDPSPVDAVRGLQPERDVYSVAALGWFCLTGQAPNRTSGRPPLPLMVPEVPPELAAALEAGLNEDRRGRPTAADLATAVYRSAAPQPLDLAASVHPTVIPELLTRRQVSATSRRRAVVEKYKAAGRRITTARWSGRPFSGPRMPFPHPGNGLRPAGGKHAGTPQSGTPQSGPAESPQPGRRRDRTPRLRSILAVSAVAAAAGAWWLSGAGGLPAGPAPARESVIAQESDGGQGPDTPAAGTAARQQARASDPAQAVQGLAALRDLAFSTGDLGLLDEVNVEGSPAAAADGRTAARLRSSGHVLAGFSSTLADLRTEDGATAARALVRVRSSSSAYEEKDARGNVIGAGPAGASRQLRLVLVAVDGVWRISEILPGN